VIGEEPARGDSRFAAYERAFRRGRALLDAEDAKRSEHAEEALAAFAEALDALPDDARPGLRAPVLGNIAIAYRRRGRGDALEDADAALSALRLAWRDVAKGDPEALRPRLLAAIGAAYVERPGGDLAANLARAIRCLEVALRHLPGTFPDLERATILHNLGVAYLRMPVGERADNLEHVIGYLCEALPIFERDGTDRLRADVQYNLGLAYRDRVRGGYEGNVERALEALGASAAAVPRADDPRRFGLAEAALGTAFVRRVAGERVQNLTEAVAHLRSGVEALRQEGHRVEWARARYDLASAEDDLADATGDRTSLERVVAGYREAQEVLVQETFPIEWAEIENAVALAYARLPEHADRARRIFAQALEHLDAQNSPRERQQTLRNLGDFEFAAAHWAEAERAYEEAIAVGEAIGAAAYTDAGRREEAAIASQVYARSSYSLLRLGRPADALARLEQGKARLLAEVTAVRDLDPSAAPPELAAGFLAAREEIRALEREEALPETTAGRRSNGALGEALRAARAALAARLAAFEVQGIALSPRGLDPSGIVALAANRALVLPVVTTAGGAFFFVPPGASGPADVEEVRLDALNGAVVGAIMRSWIDVYGRFRVAPQEQREAWQAEVEAVLPRLWELLLGPVDAKLREHALPPGAEVTVMPEGGLALLPLAAASRGDGFFLDDWTVSLSPSGYALSLSARRARADAERPADALAVIDPTGDLVFARLEAERLRAAFPDARELVGAEAIQAAVATGAEAATYLHFACHGEYSPRDPLESALQLADGLVTLRAIAASAALPGTRLAALSACETGMTESQDAPDEYVGLPSAFLTAGAAAVLATLWAVDDLSTALLAGAFYRFHRVDGLTPAAALRAAQRWLRAATAEELGLAAVWEALGTIEARESARFYAASPSLVEFAHPFHWAAFTVTGC
jgi:CHAT domain-containing protein/tetratricopeptide (TPR) repeat protein